MCQPGFCGSADLINVFEVFLPQLLLYPNPTDPLNGEAAALLMKEPALYNQKVKGRVGSGGWWMVPKCILLTLHCHIATACLVLPQYAHAHIAEYMESIFISYCPFLTYIC